ncbi:hypothetical protein CERSUDRAFT_115511, partial [Gelatoporia subvermispora B]
MKILSVTGPRPLPWRRTAEQLRASVAQPPSYNVWLARLRHTLPSAVLDLSKTNLDTRSGFVIALMEATLHDSPEAARHRTLEELGQRAGFAQETQDKQPSGRCVTEYAKTSSPTENNSN